MAALTKRQDNPTLVSMLAPDAAGQRSVVLVWQSMMIPDKARVPTEVEMQRRALQRWRTGDHNLTVNT